MNYEDILFGLQPIINADSIKDVPVDNVYLQSYITILDQLAVSLRSPQNREIVRETGLLTQILRVLEDTLDVAIHEPENINNIKYWKLASELIRCVANCLVDNDKNRQFLLKIADSSPKSIPIVENKLLNYYLVKILNIIKFSDDDDDNDDILKNLQLRSIVLLRNLVLENQCFALNVGKVLLGPLLTYLHNSEHTFQEEPDNMVLATDLLLEFLKSGCPYNFSVELLLFLSTFCKRVAIVLESIPQQENNDNDTDLSTNATNNDTPTGPIIEEEPYKEDPQSELLFNLSEILEHIILREDSTIDFSSKLIFKIQNELLTTITLLDNKFFSNKLIVMRRLVSISGNISTVPTNSNVAERKLCYKILMESKSGYAIAAALIILSNSINSKDDTNKILKEISLGNIIKVAIYIKDPLEYQGYLDILRKLINITNAMFLSNEDVTTLFSTLAACSKQSQFFPTLTELINKLLKKVIVILSSGSLVHLFDQTNGSIYQKEIAKFLTSRDSFISCLLMDKLLVARQKTSETVLSKLWDSIFKLQDGENNNQTTGTNNISIAFLFQLTKTIGIYLRNCVTNPLKEDESNVIFTTYFSSFIEVMNTIMPLRNNTDKGSESVFNNGKFIAGMIQKLLSDKQIKTKEESMMYELSLQFFMNND